MTNSTGLDHARKCDLDDCEECDYLIDNGFIMSCDQCGHLGHCESDGWHMRNGMIFCNEDCATTFFGSEPSKGNIMTSLMKNECGECTACCHVLGIKELDKPQYQTCHHANSLLDGSPCNGCGIYASRPKECQTYSCHWLTSNISEDFRPDRCGIILEPTVTKVGPAIVVREVVPGAVDVESNRIFVMEEAEKIQAYIYIMRDGDGPGSRSVLVPDWVPPEQVEQINQVIFQTKHYDGSVTQEKTVQIRISSQILTSKNRKQDRDKRKKKRKSAASSRKRNRV